MLVYPGLYARTRARETDDSDRARRLHVSRRVEERESPTGRSRSRRSTRCDDENAIRDRRTQDDRAIAKTSAAIIDAINEWSVSVRAANGVANGKNDAGLAPRAKARTCRLSAVIPRPPGKRENRASPTPKKYSVTTSGYHSSLVLSRSCLIVLIRQRMDFSLSLSLVTRLPPAFPEYFFETAEFPPEQFSRNFTGSSRT